MNSLQVIKLAVVLFLVLGKEHWSDVGWVIGHFDWIYHGISQSVQGTAVTLPQLGYEWLLNPYRSSVELNSRSPFHCTRYVLDLKIARHYTVCYVGFP